MALRNKFIRGGLGCATLCGLTIATMIAITTGPALAQQSSPADDIAAAKSKPEPPVPTTGKSDNITMEEMMATIRRLEERVKELEANLAKSGAQNSASANEIKTVQQDVTNLKEEKAKEDKANSGFISFFRSTEISGFVDTYYGYNFNRPNKDDNQLRNFDTKHNQFSLNLVKLALEKKPTDDSRLGFRTDLSFGPATEIVHASEPGGLQVFKYIQQAYLSYLAPVGKGLQIDAGKFVTHNGAEVIETKDNWNYSRSLLFALAIPYYHFGVRATYPFNSKFTLAGYVVNGWNNVVDNNHRKTFGVQAVIKPTTKLTIVQNYTGGPEQPNDDKDWRHLWDTVVSYNVTPALSLMVNYDYGFDRVARAGVHWQGVAAYARYQVNKWLAFAPRVEWYDDHDGFTTGARQTLKEFTMTSEHKIYGNLLTRLEYRHDFSDKNFFIKPVDRLVMGQSTLTFGVVYAFSSKGEQ